MPVQLYTTAILMMGDGGLFECVLIMQRCCAPMIGPELDAFKESALIKANPTISDPCLQTLHDVAMGTR